MTKYTVADLAKFIEQEKGKHPYIFFTGAGCSVTAGIPLASGLVKEINDKYPLELKILSDNEKNDYGRCMAALDKNKRRELISCYVDKAQINWTHIALASLLENKFTQRVLTFNFDNLMIRSCGLLGFYPFTYDFTHVNIDLHTLIAEPAVIYLHGQSHGFLQLNTSEETEQHAEKLATFIANTLNTSPCIFAGYSGENDAFFEKLYDKYNGQHRLFWLGRKGTPPPHVEKLLNKNPNITQYIQYSDADLFFIELAQNLGCFPPKLFTNPYNHLLNVLKEIVSFPFQESGKEDLLLNIKKELEEKDTSHLSSNTISNLETLLMKGDYEKITELPSNIIDTLDNHNKQLVAWAYIMQGNNLSNLAKTRNDESLFQQAFEKYNQATIIQPHMAEAWNNWGASLTDLAKIKSNENLFQQAFEIFEKALKINPDKLYNLACLLAIKGDIERCKEKLLHCKKAGTLPPKNHVLTDIDLENIRETDWFRRFINDLE